MPWMTPALEALWDVVRVALVGMSCVNIFGVYFHALCPPEEPIVFYECDFKMNGHIMTKPCEIRSVSYE